MEQQLHFIVGIGRSGTTVLNKILNNYKQIHCLPEANFLVFCLHYFKHKKTFTSNDIDLLFQEIELYACSHPWVGWEFDCHSVKQKIIEQLSLNVITNYETLCQSIYQEFKVVGTHKSSAEMLIDKNPSYTIYINEIFENFPQAKFIWIVRDYRANVLSRKQSVFLQSPKVAYNAIRWAMYNKRALLFSQKHPNKILRITYEDLVLKTETTTQAIENFLGLKKEFETENFAQQQQIDLSQFAITEKYKDRFIKKYSDLNKNLNTTRIDAWKGQLTQEEIICCEVLCEKIGTEIGYYSVSKFTPFKTAMVCFKALPYLCLAYIDILKDKFLYYLPISFKLKRLRKKYIELGFITK